MPALPQSRRWPEELIALARRVLSSAGPRRTEAELVVPSPPQRRSPPVPESADRRYVTALTNQAMRELFPNVRPMTVLRDEVMLDAVERRVSELYWSRPASPPRATFYEPIVQAP